jgi:hypothetical protein
MIDNVIFFKKSKILCHFDAFLHPIKHLNLTWVLDFNLIRKRKIIELAFYVAEEAEHPMNQHLEKRRTYDQYAERPKLTKPFFC